MKRSTTCVRDFAVSILTAALLFLSLPARAETSCCLELPPAPDNAADGLLRVTFGVPYGAGVAPESSLFTLDIASTPTPPIPVGRYAAWCFDILTEIDPVPAGTLFGGALYSTCDPNTGFNQFLPNHPGVIQNAAAWKKINYLINHRFSACNGLVPTMWEVQRAIFLIFGQSLATISPPVYPTFREAVVQCLVADANANAASWEPACGDKVAVIFNIDVNWDDLEPDVQLIFLEVPYCPPIACPTNVTVECNESLNPDENPKLGKPTTDECCPIQTSYVDSISSGNCPGNYVVTRTWTASIACRTNTCVQNITVTDTSKPVVTIVPPGGYLGCNPAVLPTDDSVRALVAAIDICGQVVTNVTHVDVPAGCIVERRFTVIAVDQCGNESEPKTVVYSWKVDLTPPVLIGLPDATATYQCLSEVPTPPTVTAHDNCDGVLLVTYVPTETGGPCDRIIIRVWTVMDSCDNAASFTQTITVKDTTKPVLTVPADLTVECSLIPAVGSATATDNCDANPVVEYLGETSTGDGCTNIVVRTWKAVDDCGNAAFKSQTIVLIDTTAPVLDGVPADVTVQCPNVPEVPKVTASDVCDTNVIVPTFNESRMDGSCAGNYVLIRTWVATDACGNSVTNRQTITIRDTTAPTITCVPNKSVECGLDWSFDAPTASDTCGGAAVSILSTVTNGTACNLAITRTWEAADDCGNKASCSQTITVRDATPPVITCPPDVVFSNAITYCSYTPGGWGAPPNGSNPGMILANGFSTVYPGGYVEIGIPGSGGKSIKFTSAAAIEAFLPSGGTPGVLTSDLSNPTTTTSAGVFAQHVLALTLNVNFGAAGIIGTPGAPLGDLVLNDAGSALNGLTITQILALANLALGGGDVSPYGVTLGDLATTADLINNGFDNCAANAWAIEYLLPAGSGAQPGTATATDICDPDPAITYTDVVTQEPCGAITNRTWKATDECGNVATCVQILSPVNDMVCLPGTFNFNGSTSTDGTDGNIRTFTTTNGVSVKVSAWSRNKSTGNWSPAFLGQYGGGAGVTDNTEGSGSGNAHTVDNVGEDNFVLFEFSEPVVASQACLGYVVDDSDLTLWIGNFTDPFNNHLNLNDGVLATFAYSENNLTDSASTRCADFNAGQVVGNALLIAAWPGDDTPEDKFKISTLAVCKRTCTPPPPPCSSTICGKVLRDCNADGNLSGEEGLSGFTVKFRNSGGTVVGTASTDGDGNFCSGNLAAGTYSVEVVPPSGYSQTYDPDGTKNHKTSVSVGACENKTGIKFGYTGTSPAVYLVKTGPATAKVGDTITYKFAVTNVGNTCLYGGMSINDPMLGGVIWYQSPVVPGEGFVITKTYTIKTSDPKTLCNTATAIGHPPFGLPTVTYDSSWTVNITGGSLPKPPCPTVQPGNCQVKLTCYGIPGWSSFKVKRSTMPGGPYTVIKSGLTSTSYTDTTCANGGLYYYVVSCVVNGVESPNSDPACAIPSAGLPSPWQTKDIGSVGLTGGASYDSGTHKFSVIGSGADIWNTSDEFRYVYQQAYGNCTIVARVTSVGNSDQWAKAGVMIRETLTAGSKHASDFVTPGNGVAAQYRGSTGGTSYNSNTTGLSAPYWVKVVRSGDTFTAYRSSNGWSWTTMWSKTIYMSSNVYIGLAVTSHNDGAPCAATFDNVSATP